VFAAPFAHLVGTDTARKMIKEKAVSTIYPCHIQFCCQTPKGQRNHPWSRAHCESFPKFLASGFPRKKELQARKAVSLQQTCSILRHQNLEEDLFLMGQTLQLNTDLTTPHLEEMQYFDLKFVTHTKC